MIDIRTDNIMMIDICNDIIMMIDICNDIIEENTEYVYLPRSKRDKLSLKWVWPVRKIKKKHLCYLKEFQKQGQMVTKWTTR